MSRISMFSIVIVFALVLAPSSIQAAPPQLVNYEGLLTDCAVDMAHIGLERAINGEVIKWNGSTSAPDAQMSQYVQERSIDIGVAAEPVIDFSDSWYGDIRTLDRHNNQMSIHETKLQFRQTLFAPAMANMELASYPPNLNTRVLFYYTDQSEDTGDIWDDHAKEIALVAVALLVVVLILD